MHKLHLGFFPSHRTFLLVHKQAKTIQATVKALLVFGIEIHGDAWVQLAVETGDELPRAVTTYLWRQCLQAMLTRGRETVRECGRTDDDEAA